MHSLSITAPAKINLFLGVGPVRPDHYHSVQTVLHTLGLADTVRLTPADELSLTCDTDLGIPAESNLAFRAARSFSAVFDVDVLLEIELIKRIPAGAGLGGGSSDAAAVLAGLAFWAGLPRDDDRLMGVAGSLGSDVPFLVLGGAALMGGRGDTMTRVLEPLTAPVVLVRPPAPVPTLAAYRAFDAAPQPAGESRPVAEALHLASIEAVAAALSNNMTAASTTIVPQIADALGFLAEQPGVLGSAMAGSGSAVFAICEEAIDAEHIAAEAAERGWWSCATELSPAGPAVTELAQ